MQASKYVLKFKALPEGVFEVEVEDTSTPSIFYAAARICEQAGASMLKLLNPPEGCNRCCNACWSFEYGKPAFMPCNVIRCWASYYKMLEAGVPKEVADWFWWRCRCMEDPNC